MEEAINTILGNLIRLFADGGFGRKKFHQYDPQRGHRYCLPGAIVALTGGPIPLPGSTDTAYKVIDVINWLKTNPLAGNVVDALCVTLDEKGFKYDRGAGYIALMQYGDKNPDADPINIIVETQNRRAKRRSWAA